MANPAIERILQDIGDASLLERLMKLPTADRNSLLLEIFRLSSEKVTPQDLMRAYEQNRFVSPSAISPLLFLKEQLAITEIAEHLGFESLELSPLAPIGNCSSIALADQNKIISATRGTEVVADATNLLALESALRRKSSGFDNSLVHLSATHRHVRAQALPPGAKGFTAHFKIFCATSAGRDSGNLEFEKSALSQHLQIYKEYLVRHHSFERINIIIKGIKQENNLAVKSRALFESLQNQFNGIDVTFQEVEEDQHRYYQHTRFSLNVWHKGTEFNLGDGGFLDWSEKLCQNKKERFFSSAIGLELAIKLKQGLIL